MRQQSFGVQWPNRWERLGLWLLLATFVLFGLVVEMRSALLRRRMGDLGVYLRAAWAVRQGGAQLYTVTCNSGWHYIYPPLLAVLLMPMADPPARQVQPWALPYAASVAVWYVFSLLCLVIALHVLASALEEKSPDPAVRQQPRGCRRWWGLRVWPLLACLPPIGGSLVRGQVTLLLLALVCCYLAATLRGRRLTAGLWLAAAICLKIIPALLLVVPLVRRDGRCLAGCAVGLVAGLFVVPAAAMGPTRTIACYRQFAAILLGPALGVGDNRQLSRELIEVTATDSQSFLAAIHNTTHLNRWKRPGDAAPAVRRAHWLLGAGMLLLTLWAFHRRGLPEAQHTTLFVGALTLNMVLTSPVCHLHYFALAMPLVMGLLAAWGSHSGYPSWRLACLLVVNAAANGLPMLPGRDVLRDVCLAMYAAVLLWAMACVAARRAPAAPGTADLPLAA